MKHQQKPSQVHVNGGIIWLPGRFPAHFSRETGAAGSKHVFHTLCEIREIQMPEEQYPNPPLPY